MAFKNCELQPLQLVTSTSTSWPKTNYLNTVYASFTKRASAIPRKQVSSCQKQGKFLRIKEVVCRTKKMLFHVKTEYEIYLTIPKVTQLYHANNQHMVLQIYPVSTTFLATMIFRARRHNMELDIQFIQMVFNQTLMVIGQNQVTTS